TYWKNIPSMVSAREGRRERAKAELGERFQFAIDEAAMRAGLIGTDAYLEQWRRGDWQEREGSPNDVAAAVAAELEAEYTPERLAKILRGVQ
ncbi:MAG: virulence factor, partial [Chloroflexi bacterium]|nr:virulence factor [Chloroflexota bacterium]